MPQNDFDFEVDSDGARLTYDDAAISVSCRNDDEVDYSVGLIKKKLNVVARKMKQAMRANQAKVDL